jgi:hypothetical protein
MVYVFVIEVAGNAESGYPNIKLRCCRRINKPLQLASLNFDLQLLL